MAGNNGKPESNFRELLAAISAILGFFVALVSFILNVLKWAQDPQTFRIVSVVGFILYLLGSLWFTFKVKSVNQKWRWVSLVALYVFSNLYFIWVGTWMVPPAPTTVTIDCMRGVSLWSTYWDDKGSSVETSFVQDEKTNLMEIDYTIETDGYVAVSREISSEILSGTQGIRFSYKGSGAPNTIELKMIYRPDAEGKSAVFSVLWNRATGVQDWTSLESPYSLFVCWTDTGCQAGESLDLGRVWKIDIAISNKKGDTPGSGTVLIDCIYGIRQVERTGQETFEITGN